MPQKNLIVAIFEPSYIIRKGMIYVLSQIDGITKVLEISSIDVLKTQSESNKPDALIINPMLLGQTGKQDIRTQLGIDRDVVVLALIYNLMDEQLYRSYDGVIMINDSKSKITSTINDCCLKSTNSNSEQEDLSEREIEILISVVKGMSNKEIADYHNISIHTVITHRRNITRKLKVHSISGLTIYAIINNLIDISEIQYQDK